MANILVVEDDPIFRDSVIGFLKMQGHEVDGAASAAEAVTKVQATSYQLLLNDIRIQGELDGVEALEVIRRICPEIRCILMTGFSDADAPLRAARLQADDYLLKPFKLQTLLQSVRSVLEKDWIGPESDESPSRELRWLFDERLQLLEAHREVSLHQFFLLVRSQRLSTLDAYALFCIWEQLELDYMNDSSPHNWPRLTLGYQQWQAALPKAQLTEKNSPTLPLNQFALLYARIQSGLIQSRQLLQAVRLLHDSHARHESLQTYCLYHWMWSDQLDQGDPFLGLTVNNVRLLRHRRAPSPVVRLYEGEGERLIMCVPDTHDWDQLVEFELYSQRAQLLAREYQHVFLSYQGSALSLEERLRGQKMDPYKTWRILRPVFVQVCGYHQQKRSSGCFSLRDIDSPPGQPCHLSHFSPAAYQEAHQKLAGGRGILSNYGTAPEVLRQPEPTPLSDQAVLGRLLFEVVHGGNYPDANLRQHIRLLGNPDSNRMFAPHLQPLGPLKPIFYKLAHADPAQRYANLEAGIAALDQATRASGTLPPA
jgi:DNA-binding NarL/FixJ family response regulator